MNSNNYEKEYFDTINNDTREVLEITEVKKTNKHSIRKQLSVLLVVTGLIMAGTGIVKFAVARTPIKLKTKSLHYDPIQEMYDYMEEARKRDKQELDGFLLFASSILPTSLGVTLNNSSKDDEYDKDCDKDYDENNDFALNLAINHMNGTPSNPMVNCDFATNLAMSQFMKAYQNNHGGLKR